jgi:hypothetical protein
MRQQNHLTLSSILLPAVFIFLLCVVQSCTKTPLGLSKPSTATNQADTSQYVQTLQGMLPRTKVHYLQPGEKLTILGGHIYRANKATNTVVEDLGEFRFTSAGSTAQKPTTVTGTTGSPIRHISAARALGSQGWVADKEWENTNGGTITLFTTTSVVPPLPSTAAGQAYAIWIGVSPESDGFGTIPNTPFIIQPALAYGFPSTSADYYQIMTYFIWGDNNVVMMPPTRISPGTSYQSVIECTANVGGSFDYLEEIVNPANNEPLTASLTITDGDYGNMPIPALNFADVVLEIPQGPNAPQITSYNEYPNEPANYPNSANAVITDIFLTWGNAGTYNFPATLDWYTDPVGSNNYLRETATVPNANDNNPGSPGTIDLWFGPAPPTVPNFTCISNASQTVAILFESTTSSYTYNALIAPGSSSFTLPADTYDVIFNSPGGSEYEEIIPMAGTPGTTASNFSGSQVYQVNNITYSPGYYTITVGNNGD